MLGGNVLRNYYIVKAALIKNQTTLKFKGVMPVDPSLRIIFNLRCKDAGDVVEYKYEYDGFRANMMFPYYDKGGYDHISTSDNLAARTWAYWFDYYKLDISHF